MALWLVWLSLAAQAGPCRNPEIVDTLTVSSWNTWGLPAPLANGRRARFAHIDDELAKPDADLVLLQEVWKGSRRLLPRADLVVHAPELGDSGLALVSARPLDEIAFHRFTVASSVDRWKSKGVLVARTRLHDGTDMLVIDTHFQAGDGERAARDRAADVGVLLQAVADWAGPVLAAGDFNFYDHSPIDEESADRIRAADFEDVALALGRDEATYRGRGERFDRIYVRNGGDVCVAPVAFDVREYDGVPLSDHQRVQATVAIARDADALTMR